MGHAFQALESRDIPSIALRRANREHAEVHSTAMEFLGSRFIEHMLPDEFCDRHRRDIWVATIRPVCAITRADVYTHWIHRNPDASPDDRESKWRELELRFSPGIDWSGHEKNRRVPVYATPYIYTVPFGMVDYALAKIVAMQIACIDDEDHGRAMEIYLELCRLGGSVSLTEALRRTGLRSPFDVVASTAEYAAMQIA